VSTRSQFFIRNCLFLSLLLFAIVGAGCKTTSGSTANGSPGTTLSTNVPGEVVPGTAEETPKRYTNQVLIVRHYPKWNPVWWFGNVDSPTPPKWYRPDEPCRTNLWYWRNSLHNFTHYVIGIKDKPFVRVGTFPDRVFAPEHGWNWAVCKYKCLRLPFVSYNRGGFKFYCGWRERGNFGMKLNF
jgi:hypothetical protein